MDSILLAAQGQKIKGHLITLGTVLGALGLRLALRERQLH